MQSSILTKAAGWGLVLVFLLSCAPKKRIVSPGGSETRVSGTNKTAVLNQIAQQQLHYNTFSGRAKSSLTINEKERYDVTANVRIVRDEAIWVSVTALMGIEIARISITPDSIKIINRLQSEYVKKPIAYLHNFTGSGLDFLSLQQLLLGDAIGQVTGNEVEVWQNPNGYRLQKLSNDSHYVTQFDVDYRNNHTSIAEIVRGQQLEAFYSNYQIVAGNAFPHQVDISIVTPGLTLRSEMRYNRVVYDEKVDMPFSIPSRYSEIQ